jgi:hypothetical protein
MFISVLGYMNEEEFEEDGTVRYVERIHSIANAYNLFVGILTEETLPGNHGVGRRVL